MIRLLLLLLFAGLLVGKAEEPARRVVILKIDGLNADLLYRNMREIDPASGKPRLPWFAHIFGQNGTVFENFYTRGISLSAPSWSILDTGYHGIIRGNVEYDRYTGEVYDYLNFFPFYLSYARGREVDMPGVEVLDRAGIPLVIDAFGWTHEYQSFQLFQRGIRWDTLKRVLESRFSRKGLIAMLENGGGPSYEELLEQQTETELDERLQNPSVLYLDFFTGSVDHVGHETNDPAALYHVLRHVDTLAGRIWNAIQNAPLANQTIFAVVSDHGMNNVPAVYSETFSLTDLLNSPAGGAHHVVNNRHQLSDFKLRGLNPLVHRVITPSTASFYLAGEADGYPTAWLDIDGNERAAVHLRNNDLNRIHILLRELQKPDLGPNLRTAAAAYLRETIDRHRAAWTETANELDQEMSALQRAIDTRRVVVAQFPKKWPHSDYVSGVKLRDERLIDELRAWEREHASYCSYASHLRALLAFQPDPQRPLHQEVSTLIPELTLGDNNGVRDLEHYVVGPSPAGLALDSAGHLDPERSFRYVNYFQLLASQQVRNNPQPALSPKPIDFTAVPLPAATYDPERSGPQQAYLLYGDETHQLVILTDGKGDIAIRPAANTVQDEQGKVTWLPQGWGPGFPLHYFEDANLHVPDGISRAAWLSGWHSEREWLQTVHLCEYSTGVIGITEDLSPVAQNVPGPAGMNPILLRYERRRRELVQADFHVFAADHWNFNTRFPNPGGNHGGFFRISTHAVWMLAGAGIPTETIEQPYDGLNFASTILSLTGHEAPMPDRVVALK